ncbi:serine/threonine-protein phosphatase 6 regulatory ankyrin repeat subunit A [Biomphalaria glabrata]|nr:serine/threonine-protein phosphatase 6 regulatory ankyrin repeat subunit A [Biomphalaria glabrata]
MSVKSIPDVGDNMAETKDKLQLDDSSLFLLTECAEATKAVMRKPETLIRAVRRHSSHSGCRAYGINKLH